MLAMLFPVLILIYNTNILGKALVVLLTIALYVFNSQLPEELLINMVCKYLPYFLAGYIVRLEYPSFFQMCEKRLVNALGFFMAAAGFIFYCERGDRYSEMLCSLGALLICAGICRFLPGQKFIIDCSKWSLQMYLLNGYALVVIRTILVKMWGVSNPVFIIIVNFVFCVTTCLFAAKYILASNRVFRVCSGVKE